MLNGFRRLQKLHSLWQSGCHSDSLSSVVTATGAGRERVCLAGHTLHERQHNWLHVVRCGGGIRRTQKCQRGACWRELGRGAGGRAQRRELGRGAGGAEGAAGGVEERQREAQSRERPVGRIEAQRGAEQREVGRQRRGTARRRADRACSGGGGRAIVVPQLI